MTNEPTIALAFRFHVNFYHSYRGDSLDERGIGKDIRVIRGILDDLDRLNAEGVPARGSWDIENFYSLETMMPRFAPDILERIKARVVAGRDEVEVMSYNNGIIAAHDREEARRAIAWAVSNPAGSGLADLFGSFAPVARPQECMFTPSNIADYRSAGIETLSVYYSAIPFNGFGSFVPPLPFAARYNPLRLVPGESGAEPETLTILPAYNHGDIVERGLSLRRWLRSMRRRQLAGEEREDLILVLDLDADDYFWEGFKIPLVGRLFPSFSGLYSLAKSVADLPFLRFARPWDYLREHPARLDLAVGQDMADGSWDGFSSWAEKRENYEVWSIIDRARRLSAAAELIVADAPPPEGFSAARSEALDARVLALSTTHFGMASPVMNVERLAYAFDHARKAQAAGAALFRLARGPRADVAPIAAGGAPRRFLDPEIGKLEPGLGSLVHLDAGDDGSGLGACLLDGVEEKGPRRCVVNPSGPILDGSPAPGRSDGEAANLGPEGGMGNGLVKIEAAHDGRLRVVPLGSGLPSYTLGRPTLRYGRRLLPSRLLDDAQRRILGDGRAAELSEEGEILFPGGQAARWARRLTIVRGLPYLYVDLDIEYPDTPHRGYAEGKAGRLGRSWDARWREVIPCEIVPALGATEEEPARVWKHNFEDRVSSYRIDYHRFGPNRRIASINNHVTDGWVAVSGRNGGLLAAQSAAARTSFAFCPLRTALVRDEQVVRLNPFGTYFGPQLRSPTAGNGLGRLVSVHMGNQYDSYAPSWAGGKFRGSLMLAAYAGDRPPEGLRRDALVFASLPVREDLALR